MNLGMWIGIGLIIAPWVIAICFFIWALCSKYPTSDFMTSLLEGAIFSGGIAADVIGLLVFLVSLVVHYL